MAPRSLPSEFNYYADVWWRSSTAWLIGHFIIGTVGIFLPALIASGLIESGFWTKIVALAAAAIAGLQALLRCDSRADRFHVAWRGLNTAKFKYELDENFPISEVITAYDNGEQLIESAFTPMEKHPTNHKPPQSN